ncbi:MAG: hypothetical protein ACYDCO_26575 [Armatimonadota bacterium]
MTDEPAKIRIAADGKVHLSYPLDGALTLCGYPGETRHERVTPREAVTCTDCLAVVGHAVACLPLVKP